ncbi:hypothetical protein Hanom_Chr11g01015931 [Helianthus anomalus]
MPDCLILSFMICVVVSRVHYSLKKYTTFHAPLDIGDILVATDKWPSGGVTWVLQWRPKFNSH